MSAGLADLASAYGTLNLDGTAYQLSVIEHGQFDIQGSPWERRGWYLDNSPVFFLDRVETPLLILHGADDSAVRSSLADEVFVDLRRLGKEVEYAKYGDEDHTPFAWRYNNQLDYWTRVINWFDTHLRPTLVTSVRGHATDTAHPGYAASTP